MPICRNAMAMHADRRRKQEQPEDAGDGCGDRVRPDRAASCRSPRRARCGRRRTASRRAIESPITATSDREHRGDPKRAQVELVREQRLEIVEPDEFRVGPERILHQHRLVERLRCGPEEEHQRDRDLRRDEHVRQPARRNTARSSMASRRRAPGRRRGGIAAICWPSGTSRAARSRASPLRRAPAWRSSGRSRPVPALRR